jgi:NAD+ synthase
MNKRFLSIIPEELKINVKEVVDYIALRLRYYILDFANRNKYVVGLSGGVDSSVTTYLAVKSLGPSNVHVLLLPSNSTPKQDIEDAYELINFLNIPKENVAYIEIDEIVDEFSNLLGVKDSLGVGNIKARVRMIILHGYAHKVKGLVLGTGDKSEITIGYFTKYGDSGVDVLPIGDLYKTQVRQIAAEIGLPERIYTKPPSPALWKGQTAEGELGIDYLTLDRILYRKIELWMNDEEISKELNVPISTVEKITNMIKNSQHKRLPPEIFKISFRSHGSDWRYPREWK